MVESYILIRLMRTRPRTPDSFNAFLRKMEYARGPEGLPGMRQEKVLSSSTAVFFRTKIRARAGALPDDDDDLAQAPGARRRGCVRAHRRRRGRVHVPYHLRVTHRPRIRHGRAIIVDRHGRALNGRRCLSPRMRCVHPKYHSNATRQWIHHRDRPRWRAPRAHDRVRRSDRHLPL